LGLGCRFGGAPGLFFGSRWFVGARLASAGCGSFWSRDQGLPSPGGQANRMVGFVGRAAVSWVAREFPSRRPPQGLPRQARGRRLSGFGCGGVRVRPRARRGRASPGRRDGNSRPPTCGGWDHVTLGGWLGSRYFGWVVGILLRWVGGCGRLRLRWLSSRSRVLWGPGGAGDFSPGRVCWAGRLSVRVSCGAAAFL
jgi:hypothetical protein